MKLTAYRTGNFEQTIRPAGPKREWMDCTPGEYAYRCLPLTIANRYGWEILNPFAFTAEWNGGQRTADITIESAVADPGVVSHFGSGILTFHINFLFQTEPGYDLMVQGPINEPKHGIAPLQGIVETDWAQYSFTMNWLLTEPGIVRFAKDEPICHIFPIKRNVLTEFTPKLDLVENNPELLKKFNQWAENRTKFNSDLINNSTEAKNKGWEKNYFKGTDVDGHKAPEHVTKIKLKPFVKV
jgi:hypothetical protein